MLSVGCRGKWAFELPLGEGDYMSIYIMSRWRKVASYDSCQGLHISVASLLKIKYIIVHDIYF